MQAGCTVDSYDLLLSPGSTWAFAANSGRIAGEAVLNYIGKETEACDLRHHDDEA